MQYGQTSMQPFAGPQNAGNIPAPKDSSSLEINLAQMDEQLSRFYNYMNRLDQLANILKADDSPNKISAETMPTPLVPQDHCGKFSFHLETFNRLNDRLEGTLAYLAKAI